MKVELLTNACHDHSVRNAETGKMEIIEFGTFSISDELAYGAGSIVEVSDDYGDELIERDLAAAVNLSDDEIADIELAADSQDIGEVWRGRFVTPS